MFLVVISRRQLPKFQKHLIYRAKPQYEEPLGHYLFAAMPQQLPNLLVGRNMR